MTKKDFLEWKHHPVTKQIFLQLEDRIDALSFELSVSAGIDPLNDRHRVGYIAGLRDLLDTDLEVKENA